MQSQLSNELFEITEQFGLKPASTNFKQISGGLINATWLVSVAQDQYVLQQINNTVFKKPYDLSANIEKVTSYLKKYFPDYFIPTPINSINGEGLIFVDKKYFRLFPFAKKSHSINVVKTTQEAYEAAKQFAKFTRLLAGFDVSQLKITIPDFHNLTLRYRQFLIAVENGDKERINSSGEIIKQVKQHRNIVEKFEVLTSGENLLLRVMHHDTKISNVLFNENNLGLCVIDLDTIMPGYFFSDIGDMFRTYLSPANEEEIDLDKIDVRENIFEAIISGYLQEMATVLLPLEKNEFLYAGKVLIYMQALRFLTDHLNCDIYYGAKYPGHNLNRAKNQLRLLDLLIEKSAALEAIIKSYL
ncbi:MAG: phosphotransferase [Ginsengibacter sp.]